MTKPVIQCVMYTCTHTGITDIETVNSEEVDLISSLEVRK